MISINLIRGGLPASEKSAFQVLCKTPLDRPSASNLAALPPSLHPRLMERLLGKSPLRLIVERTPIVNHEWEEKLECGHVVSMYQDFLWTENGKLVHLEPTAKRRRCQKCKPYEAPDPQAAALWRAEKQREEFIQWQKFYFGSSFAAMCFENGELRPRPTEQELLAWAKAEIAKRAALFSPRKPVQSVTRDSKRRTA